MRLKKNLLDEARNFYKKNKQRISAGIAAILLSTSISGCGTNKKTEVEIDDTPALEQTGKFEHKDQVIVGDKEVEFDTSVKALITPEFEESSMDDLSREDETLVKDIEDSDVTKDTKKFEDSKDSQTPVTPVKVVPKKDTSTSIETKKEEPSKLPETKKDIVDTSKEIVSEEITQPTVIKEEWKVQDDDTEILVKPDGTTETRSHNYEVVSTKYVSGKDETHYIVTKSVCATCGHTIAESKKVDCELELEKFDKEKEYFKCSSCGYETSKKHELDEGKEKDGKVTYSCKHEDCGFTKTVKKDKKPTPIISGGGSSSGGSSSGGSSRPVEPSKPSHVHDYAESVTTYKTLTENTHLATTTKSCSAGDSTVIISETEENCKYTITNWNENLETLTCSDCNQTKTRSHSLDTGTLNTDGSTTYRCTNESCGYAYTKPYVAPSHTHNFGNATTTPVSLDNGKHRIDTVETCLNPNCNEQKVTLGQEQNCQYGEESITGYTQISNDKTNHTTNKKETCTVCGYEHNFQVTEAHGTWNTSPNDDGTTKYTCPDCEFTYNSELAPHVHNFGNATTTAVKLDNGKHRIDTVETCLDPNCNEQNVTPGQEQDCEYGQNRTKYENTDAGHKEITYKVCTECESETNVSENTVEHSIQEVEDGYDVYDQCTIPGCDYKNLKHTHTPKEINYERDATYCGYSETVCSDTNCNKVLVAKHGTQAHNYQDTGDKSSTQKKQRCSKCLDEKWVNMTIEEILGGLNTQANSPQEQTTSTVEQEVNPVTPVTNENNTVVDVKDENVSNEKPEEVVGKEDQTASENQEVVSDNSGITNEESEGQIDNNQNENIELPSEDAEVKVEDTKTENPEIIEEEKTEIAEDDTTNSNDELENGTVQEIETETQETEPSAKIEQETEPVDEETKETETEFVDVTYETGIGEVKTLTLKLDHPRY